MPSVHVNVNAFCASSLSRAFLSVSAAIQAPLAESQAVLIWSRLRPEDHPKIRQRSLVRQLAIAEARKAAGAACCRPHETTSEVQSVHSCFFLLDAFMLHWQPPPACSRLLVSSNDQGVSCLLRLLRYASNGVGLTGAWASWWPCYDHGAMTTPRARRVTILLFEQNSYSIDSYTYFEYFLVPTSLLYGGDTPEFILPGGFTCSGVPSPR